MKVQVALAVLLMSMAICAEAEAGPQHRRGGRRPVIIQVEQNQSGVVVGNQTQISAGGSGSQSQRLDQQLIQNQTVNISGARGNRWRDRIQVNQNQSGAVVGNQTQLSSGGGGGAQSAELNQQLVQNQSVDINLGNRGRGSNGGWRRNNRHR
ncbi:MAG: hypothetical protein AB4040_18365 [Synechococcus sp.]